MSSPDKFDEMAGKLWHDDISVSAKRGLTFQAIDSLAAALRQARAEAIEEAAQVGDRNGMVGKLIAADIRALTSAHKGGE